MSSLVRLLRAICCPCARSAAQMLAHLVHHSCDACCCVVICKSNLSHACVACKGYYMWPRDLWRPKRGNASTHQSLTLHHPHCRFLPSCLPLAGLCLQACSYVLPSETAATGMQLSHCTKLNAMVVASPHHPHTKLQYMYSKPPATLSPRTECVASL